MSKRFFFLLILTTFIFTFTFSKDFSSEFQGLKVISQKAPFSEKELKRSDIKPGIHNMLFLKGDPEVFINGDFLKIKFKTYGEKVLPVIYIGKVSKDVKLSFPEYYLKLKPRKVDGEKNLFLAKIRINTLLRRTFGLVKKINVPLNFTYKLIFFVPQKYSKSFISYLYHFSLLVKKEGNSFKYFKLPSFDVCPIVDFTGDNEVTISFRTSERCLALLKYGNKKLDERSDFISYGKEHFFKIKTSGFDKKYKYRVFLKFKDSKLVNPSKIYSFKTKCKKNESFSFGVFGDCRAYYENSDSNLYGVNYAVMKDVLRGFYATGVDFVVGSGDYATLITNSPLDFVGELNSYRKVASYLSSYIPFFEVRGDHEMFGYVHTKGKFMVIPYKLPLRPENILPFYLRTPENGPKHHKKNFPPLKGTVFSFVWGNSMFIGLDTAYGVAHGVVDPSKYNINGTLCDEEFSWLKDQFEYAKRKDIKHVFLFDHAPPFPNGGHVQDAMYYEGKVELVNEVRERLLKMLSKYRVDILFCGHEHNYSRTLVNSKIDKNVKNSFWQIISGGAGAPTYPIDPYTPWHKNVKCTSVQKHFVVVKVNGKNVMVNVFNRNLELIDSFSYVKK